MEGKTLEQLAHEYAEKFGDNFPFFGYSGEADVKEVIARCIETGKPYEADYKDDADY